VSILVIDVGTTGLRAAVVRPDATVTAVHYLRMPPATPAPGLVEVDGEAMATGVLEVARASLDEAGPVAAVGIANQRATTLLWDRATGRPVGPGLGWQDLRTLLACLTLQSQGLRFAPNQSATKLPWLLDSLGDGGRDRDLCFGTVDTWVAWTLSGGALHVTDTSNAAITGLLRSDASGWQTSTLEALDIPAGLLPMVVDSSGVVGEASALPGAPPIAGIAGDQQASLVGQGCVRSGLGKITFGSGGMLDLCLGDEPPAHAARGPHGTFPIVAWTRDGRRTWGVEGVMLSAGTNVEWLVDDLGLLASPAESAEVAAQRDDAGGVVYVPALLGIGTPAWDYGARGTLLGLTRGSGRAEIVRAVLEGIAHRGADLVEAAEADTGVAMATLRIDGGMSANPVFVEALAAASGRPVEVAPVTESTTLGAAFLAGLAVGTLSGLDDVAASWRPRLVVEPERRLDRDRWAEATRRASAWIPDLSSIDF
jgi:glycerol kinase